MMGANRYKSAPAVFGTCFTLFLCILLLARSAAAPRNNGRTFRRGVELYQANRLKEAVRLFQQATSENPSDSNAYYYLGLAQQRLESHDKAILAFKRALEQKEDFEEVHLPLGISLYSLNRHEEARLELTRALRSDPANPSAHLFLGLIYMKRKQYPIAEPHFEAAALNPELLPVARLNLGTLALRLHQVEKARREFEEVLRVDPESDFGRIARVSLETLSRQEKAKRPWKLDVEAGFEHSDKVTRVEVDQVTNESDFSAILSGAASYRVFKNSGFTGNIGYNFYQQLHDKVTSQDFQCHTGEMTLYRSFSNWEAGAEYSFNYNLLDGNDFLQIQTATARLHLFPVPWFFSQLSYNLQEKVFFEDEERDALSHLAGVNQFFFFDDSRGFVSLGLQYENENARSGEFDFRGLNASATLRLPLAMLLSSLGAQKAALLLPPDLSIEGSFSYRGKDYTEQTDSIGRRRNDDIRVYKLALKGTLLPGLTATIQNKYTNNGSNLESVDYTENTFIVLFAYHF